MPIQTENHRIVGARYVASPNVSGALSPRGIMLHFTASYSSAVAWLTNPAANASAHVEVDNDGTLVQMVPFNVRAWHAGTANKGSNPYPNATDIGVEIVNPGFYRVDASSPTGFRFPDRLPDGSYAAVPASVAARYTHGPVTVNPVYGSAPIVWVDCLPAQIAATKALVSALCAAYPGIVHIGVHSDARSDKSDFLSPRFPIDEFKALVPRGGAAPSAGLFVGMPQSPAVEALQRALVDGGWLPNPRGDQVDGWFGEGTKRAVVAFQTAKGLVADGVARPATLAALGLA